MNEYKDTPPQIEKLAHCIVQMTERAELCGLCDACSLLEPRFFMEYYECCDLGICYALLVEHRSLGEGFVRHIIQNYRQKYQQIKVHLVRFTLYQLKSLKL